MQERAFGGEARTQRDHDTPVTRTRLSVLQHLVQHEQDGGRGQIAESPQNVARELYLVVRELEVPLGSLEHPPTCRVEDPEPHVFPSPTVVLEDAFRELSHHQGRDPPHILAQTDSRSATREGEAHAVEIFGPDDRSMSDEGAALALRAQQDRAGQSAPARKRVEIVGGLLEGDDGAGTAGITHVHALDVVPEAARAYEARIEARHQAAGAGRRGQKVDLGRIEAPLSETGVDGLHPQGDAARLEAGRELIDVFVRPRPVTLHEEVPALDAALSKQILVSGIRVTEDVDELVLGERGRWHRRPHGEDLGTIHRGLSLAQNCLPGGGRSQVKSVYLADKNVSFRRDPPEGSFQQREAPRMDRNARRVLVIEDDPDTAEQLVDCLRTSGYMVDLARDGQQGLALGRGADYVVMTVDRMLPRLDGIEVIRRLRDDGIVTPTLIISALGEVDDRVRGLRAGGDDYLVKPFAFAELLARVDSLARRSPTVMKETVLRVGDLEMDLLARAVRRKGREIELLPKEFQLLAYLARHAGQVIPRALLLQHVWDLHFDPMTNIIDVYVGRLRRKVEGGGAYPLIHTVRGVGFCLRAPE